MIVPSLPSWNDCSEPRAKPFWPGADTLLAPPNWVNPETSTVTGPVQLGNVAAGGGNAGMVPGAAGVVRAPVALNATLAPVTRAVPFAWVMSRLQVLPAAALVKV